MCGSRVQGFLGGSFLARINIEDSLYRDGRFTDLCIKLGSKWAALGALVEAWTFAQSFVTIENPKGTIPKDHWERHRICNEIIAVGLAEISGDQVVMSGALNQFAWLVTAKIKGAAGGSAKANKTAKGGSSAKPSSSPAYPLTLTPLGTKINLSSKKTHTSHCPDVEQPELSPDLGDGLHWLAQLWNDFCGTHLAKVKLTTPGSARMKKIVARTKAHPDRQQWALAIQNLAKSDFHTGQSGKRGERPWKADFDWFLSKEENFARGIEDSFAGKSQKHFTHERENEQTTDEILADVYKAHGMEAPGGTKSR